MEPDSPEPIERLSPKDCWELLGAHVVGRLAVIVDHHPEIFPVNYVVDGATIVFRTGAGTKFWGSLGDACALEIDGYKKLSGKAWSVMVQGKTKLILDPSEKAAADALHLDPWIPVRPSHYLRLTPESVTGRRFKTTRPDIWDTPVTDPRTSQFL